METVIADGGIHGCVVSFDWGVRMTSCKATEETVRRLFRAYLRHGMNRDKAAMLIGASVGMTPSDVMEIIKRDTDTGT